MLNDIKLCQPVLKLNTIKSVLKYVTGPHNFCILPIITTTLHAFFKNLHFGRKIYFVAIYVFCGLHFGITL